LGKGLECQLETHSHIKPTLTARGAITLFPLYALMSWIQQLCLSLRMLAFVCKETDRKDKVKHVSVFVLKLLKLYEILYLHINTRGHAAGGAVG